MIPFWTGVFTAVSTQFKNDESLDLESTSRQVESLIASVVSGVIVIGSMGDSYGLFTGVDILLLEYAILGIDGWVAGSGIAFPAENQYLWDLTRRGDWEKARALYRWFTPLLHLDVSTKFVQYIKLAVQECGLGREWVRAPRLPLAGEERKRVLKIIQEGIAQRPKVPKRQG